MKKEYKKVKEILKGKLENRPDKSIKSISTEEAQRIKEGLEKLELDIYYNDGLKFMSGGFVAITLIEVEEPSETFHVMIESGIQSGGDSDYVTTTYRDLDQETFDIV
jgi:hypothetical protein